MALALKTLNDWSRQGEWFDGERYKKQIHVIGVGATGSWLVLQLAKMGAQQIHIWDFDIVEEHNVANQIYSMEDCGKFKVDALETIILEQTGAHVIKHNEAYDNTKKGQLSGVVFNLVDTMAMRKEFFEGSFRFNPRISLIVETRMSIDCGRVYAFNPMDAKSCSHYATTLYGDDEAEVSFCGSSLSIVTSASNIASYAVWCLIKDYKHLTQQNELIIDYLAGSTYPTTW